MIKERMTPEELARLTGYSRQTINKWVRKEDGPRRQNPAFRVVRHVWSMLMRKYGNLYAMRVVPRRRQH